MTTPPRPPTVAPPPSAPRRRRPAQLAFGVVVIVAALALGWLMVSAAVDQLADDDAATTTSTTTTEPTAGLTGEDVAPAEPWIVPDVPEPVRGRAEVAGYQARLVGEQVDESVAWAQGQGAATVRGTGASAVQHHVTEQLLTTNLADPDPDLEAIALSWADDIGGEITSRATTVDGQPAWFAHAAVEEDGRPVERYVVVFDAGSRPVIAVAEGADLDPASFQAEWLAFVASIAPA